jgi:hypothetical protein
MPATSVQPTRHDDTQAAENRGQAAPYEIADPRWRPPTEDKPMTKKPPAPETQGKAVREAIEGDRSHDIDRWQDGFSRTDAARLAQETPDAEQPALPRAGLARDGGLLEGDD